MAALSSHPLPVDQDGGKSSRGTVLVVGGSRWTGGAVVLSGLAALRMGAGRLQLATAASLTDLLTIAVPEAMVVPIETATDGALRVPPCRDRLFELAGRAQSVVLGPGILDAEDTTELVELVLRAVDGGAVLTVDAVALRHLAGLDRGVLDPLRGRLVLTPNDEELDALLAGRAAGRDRITRCRHAADRYGAVVTCFGVVAAPDGEVWASRTRCPGLGTSGSGDVLAGLVAGAAARAADPTGAACWATHVHLEAGVRLERRCGAVGFLGRELIDETAAVMGAMEPP